MRLATTSLAPMQTNAPNQFQLLTSITEPQLDALYLAISRFLRNRCQYHWPFD